MRAPRGTILKSVHGIPFPTYPRDVDLRKEARTARRRFYPVTALYTSCALVVLVLAFRERPWTALAFALFGIPLWTLVEYTFHRFLLHGRFPDGPGPLKHLIHLRLDTMHGDHHLRPWDGMYINGFFETLPLALVLSLLGFLAPLPTAPVVVAMLLLCYVGEEWVHYSTHFHRFRRGYFGYIRRHHLYHHSPRGTEIAFGLTSGLWDEVMGTRIPEPDRRRLYTS